MAVERDDLKEILAAVATAGFEEFSLEIGDMKIRLTKQGTGVAPGLPRATAVVEAPAPSAPSPARPTDSAASRSVPLAPPEGLVAVTAPLLGTFYRAPAPDAPPFVEVGSVVEPDDTVCIIEVMKMMNSVPAGVSGTIAEVCCENAALVEYGQPLFRVAPK